MCQTKHYLVISMSLLLLVALPSDADSLHHIAIDTGNVRLYISNRHLNGRYAIRSAPSQRDDYRVINRHYRTPSHRGRSYPASDHQYHRINRLSPQTHIILNSRAYRFNSRHHRVKHHHRPHQYDAHSSHRAQRRFTQHHYHHSHRH
ncbi:hypothetical protein Q4488_17195 [Amphritea sp. 1_MG-2023]|uniref:hypothetical protein n=1 Tax=Amphritea sp. 1_MG-2023 TaxID=3062670 RepID=UPI0026E12A81|nr:hypothetical protein [Amphritea sp. 1_MG-2023]MDO6565115.1 hypothetical protein [Amphritea sp. 1_MG-2023]